MMRKAMAIGMALALAALGCEDERDAPGEAPQVQGDEAVDAGGGPAAGSDDGNGAPAPEGQMRDGQRHGPWTFYHDNGHKAASGAYRQGLKHGRWTFWYENGHKTAAGRYQRGRKVGKWIEWNRQGEQVSERVYADGLQVFR